MKIVCAFLTVAVLVFSSLCLAAGQSGQGNIDHIYQRSFDGHLYVKKAGGSWNNPDGCASSDRLVLVRDNPSRSEFYSAILAAQLANRQISAWISGCIDWGGTTYPEISGLSVY